MAIFLLERIIRQKTTNAQVKLPLFNAPCGQKTSHMDKQMIAFIPQSLTKALDLLHSSLTELPSQAMILFSDKDLIQGRWAIASNIAVGLNKKLAAGELKDFSVICEDQEIDVRDDDSDESVGQPRKKRSRKPYKLSTSEEKFILHLHSCISMHLRFHAPFNDDEWCYCPFSKTLNQKWQVNKV